jgi:beta-lactamase regulating signal transducer with metallopeptidase domain
MPEDDPLLLKCEELLEILYASKDHTKPAVLTGDIEELRDRLLAANRKKDSAASRRRRKVRARARRTYRLWLRGSVSAAICPASSIFSTMVNRSFSSTTRSASGYT